MSQATSVLTTPPPNITELETIVVSAQGFEQDIKTAPASISVITRKDLDQKNYQTVFEALKDVSGLISFSGAGGAGTSEISMRGMGSAYTLFLVDGKRISNRTIRPYIDTASVDVSWLPNVESIERIEIIRGPMSGLYGSDAMGGVINIITKKNIEQWSGSAKFDSTIQENSASGNIIQSQLYLSGPLIPNQLNFTSNLSLRKRQEDRIQQGFAGEEMQSGSLGLGWTPTEQHRFDFNANQTKQDREYNRGKSSRDKIFNTSIDRDEYSISHKASFDQFESNSYLQREKNTHHEMKTKLTNTILNTNNQFRTDSHRLSLGGQYQNEHLLDQIGNQLPSKLAPVRNTIQRTSWALFAEDSWNLTPDFSLSTSLRYNNDQKYGGNWSPRIYAVWTVDPQWIIKGGISTGYKSPSLRSAIADWGQIAGRRRGNRGMTLGNPNLKPESSVNYEIALLWDNQDQFKSSVTLFHNVFDNKIGEATLCTRSRSKPCINAGKKFDFIRIRENIDKAVMQGVEAEFSWKPSEQLNLNNNYTYTRTEQKSGPYKGKALNEMPTHLWNSTLSYTANSTWDAWGRLNLRGKTTEYLRRDQINLGQPTITLLDAGVNYKLNSNLQLNVAVNNLFNRQVNMQNHTYILDGRRYLLGLNYRF